MSFFLCSVFILMDHSDWSHDISSPQKILLLTIKNAKNPTLTKGVKHPQKSNKRSLKYFQISLSVINLF